jgi:hypothetical protein
MPFQHIITQSIDSEFLSLTTSLAAAKEGKGHLSFDSRAHFLHLKDDFSGFIDLKSFSATDRQSFITLLEETNQAAPDDFWLLFVRHRILLEEKQHLELFERTALRHLDAGLSTKQYRNNLSGLGSFYTPYYKALLSYSYGDFVRPRTLAQHASYLFDSKHHQPITREPDYQYYIEPGRVQQLQALSERILAYPETHSLFACEFFVSAFHPFTEALFHTGAVPDSLISVLIEQQPTVRSHMSDHEHLQHTIQLLERSKLAHMFQSVPRTPSTRTL